jgi:hypothetical protein
VIVPLLHYKLTVVLLYITCSWPVVHLQSFLTSYDPVAKASDQTEVAYFFVNEKCQSFPMYKLYCDSSADNSYGYVVDHTCPGAAITTRYVDTVVT